MFTYVWIFITWQILEVRTKIVQFWDCQYITLGLKSLEICHEIKIFFFVWEIRAPPQTEDNEWLSICLRFVNLCRMLVRAPGVPKQNLILLLTLLTSVSKWESVISSLFVRSLMPMKKAQIWRDCSNRFYGSLVSNIKGKITLNN